MSYKSSKSTGSKIPSTSTSSKGTKRVTKVSSSGSSTSVASSGGTSTVATIGNQPTKKVATKGKNTRNASEPNYYPARHFYVTAGKTKQVGSLLAPTVVLCPLKMHLGTLGPKAQDDGIVSSNISGQIWTKGQGYAEVMGVVPIKIKRVHDNTTYTGVELLNRIEKVTYEYKRGGHKVISVHYDNTTTGDTNFDTLLHVVTLKILFSDGSDLEVTQPIASAGVGSFNSINTSESGRSFQAGGTNDFGRVGGLEWNNALDSDQFTIISAGAYILGYYKDQFDPIQPLKTKHWWWGLDDKANRMGTVYNQQVMEIYNGADTNTGTVIQGENGIWDWDTRYAVGNNNNFATNTGADGWTYSAARGDISSPYYPDVYKKYNGATAQFAGEQQYPPAWGKQSGLNPIGYWNSNETPAGFSSAPSNRFHPVNAYYTGGVGTTIEHTGMCITVISPDGTSIREAQPYETTGRHRRGTQLALALRALYKGMYKTNYSDFGATPEYGSGVIPACDPFNVTSEIFNQGENASKYCIANEIQSAQPDGSSSWGACNGNDTFVNLFMGNRGKGFEAVNSGSVTDIMEASFAASMGMLFDNNSFALGQEQNYTEQCFQTNADDNTYKGLVLPYNRRDGVQDNGFNSDYGGDYMPLSNNDNLIGNVVISMKPFYSYIDFPVSQAGQYLTIALQPDDENANAQLEASVEEFTPAQGIPDYVQSTLYKHPQTGTILNALPTFLDLSQFPSIAEISPTNSVNHDPNSLLESYPALDSNGYSIATSNQTVPYDLVSGQPWGRVSGRIEDQHYLVGGITYNKGDDHPNTHILSIYPKSTLTNPASLSEPAFPEIELVISHRYDASQLMPTNITVSGQTISNGTFGFNPSNYAATQIKSGLTVLGIADVNSDTLGNTTDVYGVTYTPGKNPLDNAAFPNNTNDLSDGSEITGFAPEDAPNLMSFISNDTNTETRVRITGETTLDKVYIDVDVEDQAMEFYNITTPSGQQINTVSNIRLEKSGMAQVGSEGSGQTGARFALDFPFVTFGMTDFETGPPTEDIPGCTDATATNFDELANVDDGSCIYCAGTAPGGVVNPFEYIVNGISGEVLDAPTLVGNTAIYGNLDVVNEDWYLGHFGNAVNYSPPSQGIAFDNQAATSQWTSFQVSFDVNASAIIGAANNAGSTVDPGVFLQEWSEGVELNSYVLLIYKVEDFDSDQYQWAQESGTPSYDTIPVVDGAQPVAVLPNLGTNTNLKFGTEEGDVGNITLGLEAGTHYVAVLRVHIKKCNEYYHHAYNFWVLYCDCDDNSALNFAGDDHPYPWSDTSAYPGGYSTSPFSFCQSTEFERRMWLKSKRSSDEAGLCLYPEPYVDCSEFIDFCITSSTFECVLTGDIVNGFTNIGTGSIYINVFGVYTGSDIIGQEFALVVDGILFEFILTLTDASTNEVIEQIAVNTYDDYLALTGGIQPQNVNGVNIAFNDVPQGQYIVTLDQVGNLFPGQDPTLGPCQGLEPSGTFGTINVGVGENCEDIVPGCNDPLATNYNPNATTTVNGEPFDAYNELCEYNDCSNVFETVRITGVTTTNSPAECATQEVDTDGDGVLDDTENYLADTAGGGAAFTVFDPDGPTNFNIGVIALVNGNESVGVASLLEFYTNNYNAITSTTTTDASIPITQGSTVVGAFLPTNVTTVPEGTFSAGGMYAGNYLAFALPQTIDPDFTLLECETQLLEFADEFENFVILLDASAIVDCSEPCNEVTNPADCDDYVPGCTDVSATNFNELANYDDGTCEYGGTETCITNPELPECEECEDEEGVGLRNCDETFGNTEGCGDPGACNYNPDALIIINGLCEYCCDGDENCVENEDEDDCEDADGTVDPNCTDPICPDPLNPDCDTVVVNPCPTEADCPPPPIPDCIALGNCGDGGPGTEDPDVIIDDVVTIEVSCDPLFNSQEFDVWRTAAMTCSATEGSKMLFKLRAGVKDHNEQDLIKLTLINYLFNQGVDLPCLFSCDEYENKTQNTKYREKDCVSEWKRFGSQRWTPKSTFKQGDVVRILRNVRGKTTASYFIAIKDVPAQQIRPDQRGIDNEYWVRCRNVRGQKSTTPNGVTYLRTLYEFMRKFCQNCSVVNLGSGAVPNNTKSPSIDSTGLIGDDDSEIIF